MTFSNNTNQGSLEKWLILGLGKKVDEADHLIVLVNKEVLKKLTIVRHVKRTRGQMKELPMAKAGTIWATSK